MDKYEGNKNFSHNKSKLPQYRFVKAHLFFGSTENTMDES